MCLEPRQTSELTGWQFGADQGALTAGGAAISVPSRFWDFTNFLEQLSQTGMLACI
jgi:hypothetical protein